jgi:hypothetical protein
MLAQNESVVNFEGEAPGESVERAVLPRTRPAIPASASLRSADDYALYDEALLEGLVAPSFPPNNPDDQP